MSTDISNVYYLLIVFISKMWIISSESVSSLGTLTCHNFKSELFENVAVSSFVDENRYIRLNISWQKPKALFSTFEMSIDTNCSALYGDRNISVDQNFVIQPNLERLKHPAEPLQHGCKYDFEMFAEVPFENKICLLSQQVDYKIPECVEDICECGVADSPFEYRDYLLVMDQIYTIRFYKTDRITDLNLETVFDKIWYTNINSNKTVTLVQPGQVNFDNINNELTLAFYDFHGGNSYAVNIDLVLDSCEYHFVTKIHVPRRSFVKGAWTPHRYLVYGIVLFTVCLSVALTLFKAKPQLFDKLRRYLPFGQNSLPVTYTADPANGLISRTTKEVINSQYTPLEFIENAHKFDHFEIPRNRIVLQNEIGGGAFGKVFKAEVYEIGSKSGHVLAAAKKPIENAPSEEISDFLAEIDTMKKIANAGGHCNVIKILGCVTIDPPYLMVMELVPCGSLKSYLSNLRKEWEERKRKLRMQRDTRHFFPDNMVVENFLPRASESEGLRYSHLTFDDYTGSTHSSETNSYITPDTPSTPGSPNHLPSPTRKVSMRRSSKTVKPKLLSNKITIPISCSPPQSPMTPNSSTSSGLPSVTETLLTPLDSEPPTPLIDLTEDVPAKIKPVLDNKELQNFALQIANGMAFLESIDVTHRDLAARNILVSQEKILKISDFGMARFGVYVNTAQKRQPLRWMAPEAIENRRCDNKTDVWSFGVVLWEIGSLGAFPYKELSNERVIAHILQGKRLERPETCTDQVYELMQQCWQRNPDDRLTFAEIAKQLDTNSGKIYVDFSKISPKYVFPPTQEEIGL